MFSWFLSWRGRVGIGGTAIRVMRDGILKAVEPFIEVESAEAVEVKIVLYFFSRPLAKLYMGFWLSLLFYAAESFPFFYLGFNSGGPPGPLILYFSILYC